MTRTQSSKSRLEQQLAMQLKAAGIPFEEEYKFHPERRWRFDFAIPSAKIAIEVEGGIWIYGRHNRGSGFVKDCDKYNSAVLLGWKVLRFAPNHIKSGSALQTILQCYSQSLSDGSE